MEEGSNPPIPKNTSSAPIFYLKITSISGVILYSYFLFGIAISCTSFDCHISFFDGFTIFEFACFFSSKFGFFPNTLASILVNGFAIYFFEVISCLLISPGLRTDPLEY